MSEFKTMVKQAARAQAAHTLGFGLNTVRGLFTVWLGAELLVLAFFVGALVIGLITAMGWTIIPAAIVIVNLVRFAHAYGQAKANRK